MLVASRIAVKQLGVCANTLRKWADAGKIEYIRSPSGQRLYDVQSFLKALQTRRKVCYARVSSTKQRDDLSRQVEHLKTRFPTHEIIEDIGSGINLKRKGLVSLLESISSGDVEEIVVAHRDRLARFGFEFIQWLADQHNCRIVVLDQTALSPEAELTQDLLSILHVFSCRIHGMRKYGKAVKEDQDLPKSVAEESVEEVVWDGPQSLQPND